MGRPAQTPIHASAARTASRYDYVGGDRATNIQANGAVDYAGLKECELVVSVSAKAGTTPTLDVTLEGSVDGTNWYVIGTVAQYADATGVKRTYITDAILPGLLRVHSVIAGTNPSFTYAVVLLVPGND